MKNITEQIIKFNKERDWDQFHTPENLAKSISIEAAELLECFQWNDNFDLQQVKDELADVLNYCIVMAQKLDLNIEEIVLEKLRKNQIKYSVEKCKGISTKYDKL